MKRQIIKIDEDKCNGCGACVPNCPEGALQIINGKARLVGDLLCDGLGACIGRCPEGAILIEEREAEAYDEGKVIVNVVEAGEEMIAAHLKHLKDHGQEEDYGVAVNYLKENSIAVPDLNLQKNDQSPSGGCPGQMMRELNQTKKSSGGNQPVQLVPSELSQWPIQLHLLNPLAPYFQNADLVIAADCVAFSYGNFHQRFLKDKKLIIFCPKLDQSMEQYIEKLTQIFTLNDIKSVSVLHMEVPCCLGTVATVEAALKRSEKNVIIKDYMISLNGEIL